MSPEDFPVGTRVCWEDEDPNTAAEPAAAAEPNPEKTQWYLGDEPIGDLTADLLRRQDLGSKLAGVAALHLGRFLDDWAKQITKGMQP